MLKSWHSSRLSQRQADTTKILTLAGLIPPSKAELEKSFGLIKLICTRLCHNLSSEHLCVIIKISKFRQFIDNGFKEKLQLRLTEEGTKSNKVSKMHAAGRVKIIFHSVYTQPEDNTEKIWAHRFLEKPNKIAAGGMGGSWNSPECPG